jgi:hypothetical protein
MPDPVTLSVVGAGLKALAAVVPHIASLRGDERALRNALEKAARGVKAAGKEGALDPDPALLHETWERRMAAELAKEAEEGTKPPECNRPGHPSLARILSGTKTPEEEKWAVHDEWLAATEGHETCEDWSRQVVMRFRDILKNHERLRPVRALMIAEDTRGNDWQSARHLSLISATASSIALRLRAAVILLAALVGVAIIGLAIVLFG